MKGFDQIRGTGCRNIGIRIMFIINGGGSHRIASPLGMKSKIVNYARVCSGVTVPGVAAAATAAFG